LNPISLLLIEDDLTDQLGFKRFIIKQNLPYNFEISGSVAEAVIALSNNNYDIIIADHVLGDGTAFDLFEYIPVNTPIIFVTGNGNEDVAVKALKAGAIDYLTKDIDGNYLKLLPHTIEQALKSQADKQELAKYRHHLEKLVKERTKELQQEIKQRKSIEQQLRLLAVAFETHEAVVITDANANILRVNKAFEHLTGYTLGEVLGKNMNVLKSGFQDAEFYCKMWAELVATGRYDGEMWNRKKSGVPFPERLTITAIVDDDGVITNYVGNLADISEQKIAEDEIKKLAFYDALTGLANRRLLLDRIKQECAVAKRNNSYGAIIFIDLDNFKPINDTFGHDIGDEVLTHVATRLCATLREDDTASRLGGDEFIVLIHARDITLNTALSNAMMVASKIQVALNTPYCLNGQQHTFTASIGISIFPEHGTNSELIVNNADKAMYISKSQGGNSINIYKE